MRTDHGLAIFLKFLIFTSVRKNKFTMSTQTFKNRHKYGLNGIINGILSKKATITERSTLI